MANPTGKIEIGGVAVARNPVVFDGVANDRVTVHRIIDGANVYQRSSFSDSITGDKNVERHMQFQGVTTTEMGVLRAYQGTTTTLDTSGWYGNRYINKSIHVTRVNVKLVAMLDPDNSDNHLWTVDLYWVLT